VDDNQGLGVDLDNIAPDELSRLLDRMESPTKEADHAQSVAENTISDAEAAAIVEDVEKDRKYGDRPLAAGAAALASGLTYSLSDRVLEKSGLVSEETLRELAERNKPADIIGQTIGVIAPTIFTGGAAAAPTAAKLALKAGSSGAAKAAGSKALSTVGKALSAPGKIAQKTETQVAKLLAKAAAETGQKKAVASLVQRSLAKGAGQAAEGAAFGLNQLLREDAIGRAELNAENLLSYMGEGALIGGAIGSALVPGGAVLKGMGGGLAKAAKKVGAQIFDPIKDSARLLGLTDNQIAKFREKNPKFLEELPDWVKNTLNLKITDNADSLMGKLDEVERAAVGSMDETIERLDSVAASKNQVIGPRLFSEIAREIEERFVTPYDGMQSMRSFSAQARKIMFDLERRASKGPATFRELRDLRKKMDKLAKGFFKSMDPTEAAQAAFAARDILKRTINAAAEVVDPDLAKTWLKHNRNYHYASNIRRGLGKKAERQGDFVGFKDLLLGGIGFELGGEIGLSVAAARKFMQSDLKRRMVILTSVDKAAKNVAKRTNEALSNFFTGVSKPARLASINIMARSEFSKKEGSKEAPKNKIEAFRNVQENVVKLASNPELLMDRVAKAAAPLSVDAPNTAQSMATTLSRGLQFLALKVPKSARSHNIMDSQYMPSNMEVARFERYMQAVEDPMSVLNDLEAGTLTREHVEALRTVWPHFYSEIRNQALAAVQTQPSMPYNKKIQLGTLLNLPTDASLDPTFIMSLQQTFNNAQGVGQDSASAVVGPQTAVQTSQTGLKNLDMASRAETDTERVAKK
jgi:hypothetical protein